MPRAVRDARLDTRAARGRLAKQKEPYWRAVDRGAHLGYYRGARGGSWIARFRPADGGAYRKCRLGVADDAREADGVDVLSFSQAQAKARAWFEVEVRRAAGLDEPEAPPTGPYTVANAARDYLDWYARHRRALRETTSTVATHILPSFGAVPVDRLTARRIREWHEALADRPARLRTRQGEAQRFREADPDDPEAPRRRRSSANRVLTVLKAVLNRAHAERRVPSDEAWRRVKPFPQADAARERHLSEAECQRLLNACQADFRRLTHGALLTGARYGELCRLEVRDFDPDGRTLHVRASKAGKLRYLPLDDDAAAFFAGAVAGRARSERLFLRPDGKPWGRAHQARPLAAACEAARIAPAIGFHGLRHTWASHAVMRGAPLMVVARVLGHTDTRMVERHYGHLAPSYVRDALAGRGLRLVASEANVAPAVVQRERAG